MDASNVKEAFYLLIQKMYLSLINKSKEEKKIDNIEEGVNINLEKKE